MNGRTLNFDPSAGTSCLFNIRQSMTSEKEYANGFACTGAHSVVCL